MYLQGDTNWYLPASIFAVSSLTGLTSLNISNCPTVTAAARQALRTAIPNLTI